MYPVLFLMDLEYAAVFFIITNPATASFPRRPFPCSLRVITYSTLYIRHAQQYEVFCYLTSLNARVNIMSVKWCAHELKASELLCQCSYRLWDRNAHMGIWMRVNFFNLWSCFVTNNWKRLSVNVRRVKASVSNGGFSKTTISILKSALNLSCWACAAIRSFPPTSKWWNGAYLQYRH